MVVVTLMKHLDPNEATGTLLHLCWTYPEEKCETIAYTVD